MKREQSPIPEFMEDIFVSLPDGFSTEDDPSEGSSTFNEIQESELASIVAGEQGAEFRALTTLAKLVLWGYPINAEFQLVINLVIAKSVLRGKLPEHKKGRPKQQNGVDGTVVTEKYIQLMASGVGYAGAVAELASIFNKDERQIMRIVKENRVEVEALKLLTDFASSFVELEKPLAELNDVSTQMKEHRRKRLDPDFVKLEIQRLVSDIELRMKKVAGSN
jgi:hypothetical protein